MTRLSRATGALRDAGRPALVPFLTAGYPDRGTFRRLVAEAAASGCTILEIGVPFSDPVADGPAIQEASRQALEGGMTLVDAVALAAEAEREHGLAVVLMGYLNPILSFGAEAFADACARLMQEPELGPRLGEAARRLVREDFDLGSTVSFYREEFLSKLRPTILE